MEEQIRIYFLELGYYVARGVKFRYDVHDITDVDIFIYGRTSSLTRERINVDIKNKKTPQAFERILWANGLMKLLQFDSCIVATTDQRPVVRSFGKLHKTLILDGSFLSKLKYKHIEERLSEDELLTTLSNFRSLKTYNKDWRFIYETSKSRLLTELDFSGFNSTLNALHYFIEKILIDPQKKEVAIRMIYILLSHLLIIIDFIIKDIAFLEQVEREKKLHDGFKFGNLGKDGIDRTIEMVMKISGYNPASSLLKSFDELRTDVLKEFFAKNENAKNLFNWAREFEKLGFKRELIDPENIDIQLKGVLSMILDYTEINRSKFFDLSKIQESSINEKK